MPTTRTGSTDINRFGDLDPQGHVNQAVFMTYFESGRVAMFRNPDLGVGVPGATFVLVRIEVDYMKELHWPGTIEIGTGVAEFGRSSFTVAQAIFRDGECAATAAPRWSASTSRRARPARCRRTPSRGSANGSIAAHDPEKLTGLSDKIMRKT